MLHTRCPQISSVLIQMYVYTVHVSYHLFYYLLVYMGCQVDIVSSLNTSVTGFYTLSYESHQTPTSIYIHAYNNIRT